MSELETMLRDAAEADPVTFDREAVRDGMRRRQRARRATGVAALLLVFVVGLGVMDLGSDDTTVASESGAVGGLTVDELTADRWVLAAHSGPATGLDGAFVEFEADGGMYAVAGCELVTAQWSVDDGRIGVDDIDDSRSACEGDDGVGLADILRSDPVAERFDSEDSLALRAGDDFVAYRRFDRLGTEPTASTLTGTWRAENELGTLTFQDDGRLEVSTPAGGTTCDATSAYRIEADRIVVEDDLSNGVDCGEGGGAGVSAGGVVLAISDSPRARIENGFRDRVLWLSTDLGVVSLVRSTDGEAQTPATSLPDQRSPKDVAESVMTEVFGVSAVTMDASSDRTATIVTMEVDGGEVVARVSGVPGAYGVNEIVSGAVGADFFFDSTDSAAIRLRVPESGTVTVKGYVGDGPAPRSDDVVFTTTVDVSAAGLTEPIDLPQVTWVSAELATDRGPVLYLLSRL